LAGTAGQILDHRFQTYAPEELIGIATARPLLFAPGTAMAYSNTNYLLLGRLIGKIAGHRWGDELQQRIAGPLGLTRTRDPGSDPRLPEPHARGYLTRPDGSLVDITEMNTSSVDAAGSMISSARQLNTFFAALLSGKLLPARLVDQMTTPARTGTWPAASETASASPPCNCPTAVVGKLSTAAPAGSPATTASRSVPVTATDALPSRSTRRQTIRWRRRTSCGESPKASSADSAQTRSAPEQP
jgi:D-alanyl-D-alanine carboxypeptidase